MDTGIVIDSEFVLAEAEYLPVEIEDTGPEEVCLDDSMNSGSAPVEVRPEDHQEESLHVVVSLA